MDHKNRDLDTRTKEVEVARGTIAGLQLEIEQKDESIAQVLEHQKAQASLLASSVAHPDPSAAAHSIHGGTSCLLTTPDAQMCLIIHLFIGIQFDVSLKHITLTT